MYVFAQQMKVQNRPYTDLRPFHFGIHVGTHLQDMDFINIGQTVITDEEGNEQESYVITDQNQWEPGFNVGVLGEFRLSKTLQFRIAPAIYFGNKHLTFHDYIRENDEGYKDKTQDMRTAYIMSSFDLIFASPRFNNHRVYLMAGLTPALNLIGKDTDYIRLKSYQTFVELGIGTDRYLPYFKVRPELKFMFGLGNSLMSGHANEVKDIEGKGIASSVKSASTKMITLSFFFE